MKNKGQNDYGDIPAIIILCSICALVVYFISKFIFNLFMKKTFLISAIFIAIIFFILFFSSLIVNLRMKKSKKSIILFLKNIDSSCDIEKYYENRDNLITILKAVSKGEFLLRKGNRLDERPSLILEKLYFEEDLQVFYTIKRMYDVFRKKSENSSVCFHKTFSDKIEKCFPRFCQENKEEATDCLKKLIAYESTKIEQKNFQVKPEAKDYNSYTVYFTRGHLSKIEPFPDGGYYENREIANKASSIISDGVTFDLTNIESIQSIPVPNYTYGIEGGIGVTGHLEYVLRMRSGGYWENGEYDLAIACLEKATELMKYSPMGWPEKDFFRIVNELNDLGQFKKADRWRKWIETNINFAKELTSSSFEEYLGTVAEASFKERIKSCKELDTDLIEIGDIRSCCKTCAKYRKRVYSLSGKNDMFPKFPKDFHWGCGLNGWPYIEDVMEPAFPCEDIVSYSNRPFIDDRTNEEIENYGKRQIMLNSQPDAIRPPDLTRIIYYRLKKIIPDDTPKTVSGFSRMRKANSKKYQILVKKAEEAGFVFPESLEEVASWPENQ